jgi:hypothetical protein
MCRSADLPVAEALLLTNPVATPPHPVSLLRRTLMARIVGYIATSLDGFIATEDENLDWLTQQPDLNLGD